MTETAGPPGPAESALDNDARTSSLLRGLPDPDLAAIRNAGRILRRGPRQVLLRGGGTAALVMLSGAAMEHRTLSDGEDVVLGLLGPGDVAGLPEALGAPRAGDVTAVAPTAALLIPGGELRTLASTRPAIALAWLEAATEQLGSLRNQALAFASSSATQRVVYRLVELAERFGEPIDGDVRIPPQLTQGELGSWAGVSRESAAKALHELRRAGIVSTRRRSLTILDLEQLRQRRPGTGAEPDPFIIDLTRPEVDRSTARLR